MFYLKFLLVVLWLFVTCILGTIHSILHWGDADSNRFFIHRFGKGVLWLLGIRVEVENLEGLEHFRPCIYIANHQSALDIATFGSIYPSKTIVIAKKELMWVPFLNLYFLATPNILIDRKRKQKAVQGLTAATDALQKRQLSIWVFPEGTRNKGAPGLLPFKKGAFHMALQAGVPLIPVVSAPMDSVYNWKKKQAGGVLKVKILPPIDLKKRKESEIPAIIEEVRQKMLEAFEDFSKLS